MEKIIYSDVNDMISKTGLSQDKITFLTSLQSGYMELIEKNGGSINIDGL